MNDEITNKVYSIWNNDLERCLEPSENCNNKSIKAHSIQNKRILELIQENGHVIMPNMKLNFPDPPIISFELIGRNIATTFDGLCADHDESIFAPIEKESINMESISHLFLLNYRAVLKETYAVLNSTRKIQGTYMEGIKEGIIDPQKIIAGRKYSTAHLVNAYDMYLYKKEFDSIYLTKSYDKIENIIIQINQKRPTIAVNSLFTYAGRKELENEIERIIINVFPNEKSTWVVISFLKEKGKYIPKIIKEIIKADQKQKKYLITNLILSNCENFVMAPSFYKAIPDKIKSKMIKYYCYTLIGTNEYTYCNKLISLFGK
jgi:hypothetical protein